MFEHQSVRIPFFQPRLGYGQGNWNSIPKRDRVFSFPQRSYHIRVLPHSYPMGPVGVFLGIVRPKRDGVTGEWRKLHNEELHSLYSSPNIARVIKSRRMRWAGHVARMEEGRGMHKVLVGKPEGKNHWGDQDVDGRIILKWILRKCEGVVGTGWSWLRIGTVDGHL